MLVAAALLPLGAGATAPRVHGQLLFATPVAGYLNIATFDVVTGRLRRIVPTPSTQGQPAWSPDGNRIVFSASSNAVNQLFVVNADGSDLRQLTSDDLPKREPQWSPDGTRIAFLRADYPGITFAGPTSASIVVMNADGSNARPIARDGYAKASLSWSPDGTDFAYTERLVDRIGVVSADGKEKHDFAFGIDPAWSPDGTRLALVSPGQDSSALVTVRPDETDPHVLVSRYRRLIRTPAWSPDGKVIAFSDGSIQTVNVRTRRVRRLAAHGFTPAWSPDGRWVSFVRDIHRHGHTTYRLAVVRKDGTHLRTLAPYVLPEDDTPTWRRHH